MNTSEIWQESPARTFTNASYLPAIDNPIPEKSIINDAPLLLSDLDTVKSMASIEYGSDSITNSFYEELTEQRKNIVLFLSGTQRLAKSQIDWDESGIDIAEQDDNFRSNIVKSMENIAIYSCNAFGQVDDQRLSAIIARTRNHAKTLLNNPEKSQVVEESAERMLSRIPEVNPELATKHYLMPPKGLIEYWKPIVEKKYADLINLVPEREGNFNSIEIAEIMTDAISVMRAIWGLTNAGLWRVEIGRTSLSVDPDNQTVWVPESSSKNTLTLKKNVVHEIGGHLLRILQGEITQDPLVASDMPGRGIEEESLMTLLDQIIGGEPREAGIVDYLSIGLTQNILDQTNPILLSELETLISDFETIRTAKPLTDSLQKTAHNRAFRIARNMPSLLIDKKRYQTPYAENLKYALGQSAANKFMIDNIGNPGALDDVMLGKFAYSRPEQEEYVKNKHKGLRYMRNRVPTAV